MWNRGITRGRLIPYTTAASGMVYNEIQAADIGPGICGLLLHLVSTKHFHIVCFRLYRYLYVLYMCLYVRAYDETGTVMEIRIK